MISDYLTVSFAISSELIEVNKFQARFIELVLKKVEKDKH